MSQQANGNGRTGGSLGRLVVVRVQDTIEPRLTGHTGGSYESPPQTREQAMALVRLLLGRAAAGADGERQWTASIAGGRRVVTPGRGGEPVSEQPVAIREHIRAALLAAGPVGLTMATLAEALAGRWRPAEVQDTVRRLWQVGELARRHDGTFVLGERIARETKQADGELDEAVRRDSERARRASHQTEGRVRKVDPSLLRAYCPTCRTQDAPAGRPLPGLWDADRREPRGSRAAKSSTAATGAAAQGAGGLGAGMPALRRTEGASGAHA